jgi:hypothetical protein
LRHRRGSDFCFVTSQGNVTYPMRTVQNGAVIFA